MKYKVGDRVRVISNKSDHDFKVGVTVVVSDAKYNTYDEEDEYTCMLGLDVWYLGASELELVSRKSSSTPHYYIGKTKQIEAFDVIADFQPDNYNLGTALTYLMRAGKKPNNPIDQDIQKAINHLQNELNTRNSVTKIVDNCYKTLEEILPDND